MQQKYDHVQQYTSQYLLMDRLFYGPAFSTNPLYLKEKKKKKKSLKL